MVLGQLIQGVRRADTENMPPSSLKGAATKRNRLLTAIHNDSRRKSTTPSSSKTSKQRLELVKKRKALKKAKSSSSKKTITLTIPLSSTNDVEMNEAGPRTVKINVPQNLSKPTLAPLPQSALPRDAQGRVLENGAAIYCNEVADVHYSKMLDVLRRTSPQPPSWTSHPTEVEATLCDFVTEDSAHLPTHMVAVWSSRPQAPRKITLYPVHGDVLKYHCAALPELPPQIPNNPPASDKPDYIPLTLPVQTLCIPNPESYAPLARYLYHHNTTYLLQELLSVQLPDEFEDNQSQIPSFGARMGRYFNGAELLERMNRIMGVWFNARALAVHDEGDGLWDTLELAWEVILHAMTTLVSKSELMDQVVYPA